MDYTYCDNHLMIYARQIIMLDTLNLYRAVCQLYLNEIGREKIRSIGYLYRDHDLLQILALVLFLLNITG